jgi:hypothetical protein
MSPAPQSNQNAGAGEKSCRWCQLWNAAFAASQLPVFADPPPYTGQHYTAAYRLRAAGVDMMPDLARRKTNCPGCKRSAEIYLGDYLGDERREWRWKLVNDNSTNRALFKLGPHDRQPKGENNAT